MADDKTFKLMEKMYSEFSEKFINLDGEIKRVSVKVDGLDDKLKIHDRNNRDDYEKLDKKIDSISNVVANTMEDVTAINMKLEKQGFEIKVLKGGKTQKI
jgi:peptidoglycan hydrolase CwlO-like protein